jgi:YcxB-like protein
MMMTITYALTRTEIVRGFFRSLRSSPKYLTIILFYALGMSIFALAITGAFSRPLTPRDAIIVFAAAAGFLFLLPIVLFIRGKTSNRSFTVTPEGISTEIGTIRAQISWQKIKVISVTDSCILIARVNGNAFYVPDRAFSSPEHKVEFVDRIKGWANITETA